MVRAENSELKYFKKMLDFKMLEREEEHQLAKRWHLYKDQKAIDLLVESHLKLVVAQAFKFKYYKISVNDLIQEGIIGLITAAKKFDPLKFDIRFAGYAKWWIKAYMQDYILKNWSIVKINVSAPHKQLFFNLNRLKNQIFKLHNESLSKDEMTELSKSLKVSIQDIEEIEKRLTYFDQSLSTPIQEDATETMEAFILDQGPTPEEACQSTDMIKKRIEYIKNFLNILTDEERFVIENKYLQDDPKKEKLTGVKVKNIENRAIRKIRYSLLKKKHMMRSDLYCDS
ncbi:MAG: sigma-70 family RNA polymerase sigma factor [Proteobacteria bacterium]|nr:sigma-70 family RNA polymerase sigma factor [Pseudomonadota bacterium]